MHLNPNPTHPQSPAAGVSSAGAAMGPTAVASPHADPPVSLRREDLEELLNRAAERGAERCLAHLGLENGHAARDIRELRDLLEAWRDARKTFWRTTIRVATTAVLALLILGAVIKLKWMALSGGGQ